LLFKHVNDVKSLMQCVKAAVAPVSTMISTESVSKSGASFN
jgi:hypothetical protein